eukprot:Skav200465  [mRNA]  locus=scaffold1350:179132:181022:+ [translate_table: standard]
MSEFNLVSMVSRRCEWRRFPPAFSEVYGLILQILRLRISRSSMCQKVSNLFSRGMQSAWLHLAGIVIVLTITLSISQGYTNCIVLCDSPMIRIKRFSW